MTHSSVLLRRLFEEIRNKPWTPGTTFFVQMEIHRIYVKILCASNSTWLKIQFYKSTLNGAVSCLSHLFCWRKVEGKSSGGVLGFTGSAFLWRVFFRELLRMDVIWQIHGSIKSQILEDKDIPRIDTGVSKNWGTPKWMVYNGKPYLKWMIWRCPYFWKHPYDHGLGIFFILLIHSTVGLILHYLGASSQLGCKWFITMVG